MVKPNYKKRRGVDDFRRTTGANKIKRKRIA